MTEVLSELMQMPGDVSELSKSLLECFVVLMYNRTSDTMEVNEARTVLPQESRALEEIPPTKAAQQQQQATYQANV